VHIRFSFPLPIPESGDAPTEFRIWKWGENKTLKGTVVLDEASAKAVVSAFRDHGVELAIDYEHQTFNAEDNGKEAPAAGWFTPEVRDDGLWATAVRWTDRAAGYLKSREYRYFSPTALLDGKTRKPVRLMPMALTNWPATKDIEPLVARADETPTENTMKTVLVALGLKAEADEAEAFAAANKLREFERAILSLAGKDSVQDAIGVLTALRLKAEQADSLSAELLKLKSDQVAEQKKALIDEAIKGGIAPAKRGELEALELGALKICLSLLPKAPASAVVPDESSVVAPASGLSPDQLKILKLTGLSPEKFAEHKKALAQIVNPTEEN
jgi:phage I-like protein